jgi:hypothetical protein
MNCLVVSLFCKLRYSSKPHKQNLKDFVLWPTNAQLFHKLSHSYIILCFVSRASCVSLWMINQLYALNFSNIFICLPLSTCFGHYVSIIRRDPITLTQLLYLSFRFSCVSYSAQKTLYMFRALCVHHQERSNCTNTTSVLVIPF